MFNLDECRADIHLKICERVCKIMHPYGHRVSILCFPIEALEESESSNSTGRESYTAGCSRGIDYNEELREMREKEQLETLQWIERDLRYKES